MTNGFGGALDVKMERSYPDVNVAQFCTTSYKLVRAEKKLGMELPTELAFSADKKSIIYTKGNWRWTFTPSTTAPK